MRPLASPAVAQLGGPAFVAAMLETRGEVWVTGVGDSMAPTIREGDRVLLVPAGTLRRGDVVLGDFGRSLVLHRVLTLLPDDSILTIGDAHSEPERLPRRHVLGRAVVVERQPGGRRVALDLALRHGYAAFARGAWYRLRLALARAWRLRLRLLPPSERT